METSSVPRRRKCEVRLPGVDEWFWTKATNIERPYIFPPLAFYGKSGEGWQNVVNAGKVQDY